MGQATVDAADDFLGECRGHKHLLTKALVFDLEKLEQADLSFYQILESVRTFMGVDALQWTPLAVDHPFVSTGSRLGISWFSGPAQ